MKQVSTKKYDQKFYKTIYGQVDPDSLDFISGNLFYQELANLAPPKKTDTVIDYGCGNGSLSFYLSEKFGCKVIGIDYSPDAIKICNKRLKTLTKKYPKKFKNVQFKNLNNDELSKYKNIYAVYLCDVVEHLYPHEIELLFSQIHQWSQKKPVQVAIKTDNNTYLDYVRPFTDLLNVMLGNTTVEKLQKEIADEKAVHVNLTNPRKLKRTLEAIGYIEKKRVFPKPTKERVNKQLGGLQRIPFLSSALIFLLPHLSFFIPTFSALYEYKRQ